MPHGRAYLCLGGGQRSRLNIGARIVLGRPGGCNPPSAPATRRIEADHWIVLVAAIVVALTGYLWYPNGPAPEARSDVTEAPGRAAAGHAAPNHAVPAHAVPRHVATSRDAIANRATTADLRPKREVSAPDAARIAISGLVTSQPVKISTGLVRARSDRERIAPLEVRTSSGHNYFIRLMNVREGEEELAMYIEGGRSFATDVPLGTYELRYAAGQVWYGEPDQFGADTVCFKADKQFDFYQGADSINGHTIELILQVGGDLKATRIDPSQC